MRADYRCPCGAIGEVQHGPKEDVFVSHCFGQRATRYFCPENVFHTQEDRRHMRGEGKSHATGLPYAQSRREERAISKEKGIDFMGKSDMPDQWKMLADHARHVKAGGKAVDPNILNPPPDPRVAPGTIMKIIDKKGLRFG